MSNRKEYVRKYYAANKEEIAKRRRKHYAANKEESAERGRKYHATHKKESAEQQREYRTTHKERIAKRRRKHYAANKEAGERARENLKEDYLKCLAIQDFGKEFNELPCEVQAKLLEIKKLQIILHRKQKEKRQ